MIKQGYVSRGVGFFAESFLSKYKLRPFFDKRKPLVMFGMYKDQDIEMLRTHRAPVVLVWCGSDAMRIGRRKKWFKILKRKDVIHYATSSWISKDLKTQDIKHKILPITPAKVDFDIFPRGDSIYFYCGSEGHKEFYGYSLVREVEKRIKPVIYYAFSNSFTKEQLEGVYRDCFLGLRLTPHDGVSVTAIELGLMGRKIIFNGDTPNSIKWQGVDDICESVMSEYEIRHEDNFNIRDVTQKYIDIGNKWLRI